MSCLSYLFLMSGMMSSPLQWCYPIYELLSLLLGHMLFVMALLHVCAIIHVRAPGCGGRHRGSMRVIMYQYAHVIIKSDVGHLILIDLSKSLQMLKPVMGGSFGVFVCVCARARVHVCV